MSKVIKYALNGIGVEMGWNEINEETARREADGGLYNVVDVQPETEVQPSDTERIAELEEAMDMLLSGVTE